MFGHNWSLSCCLRVRTTAGSASSAMISNRNSGGTLTAATLCRLPPAGSASFQQMAMLCRMAIAIMYLRAWGWLHLSSVWWGYWCFMIPKMFSVYPLHNPERRLLKRHLLGFAKALATQYSVIRFSLMGYPESPANRYLHWHSITHFTIEFFQMSKSCVHSC